MEERSSKSERCAAFRLRSLAELSPRAILLPHPAPRMPRCPIGPCCPPSRPCFLHPQYKFDRGMSVSLKFEDRVNGRAELIVDVDMVDVKMRILARAAAKFESRDERLKYFHLNLEFADALPRQATGIFAELAGTTEMSAATRALLKTPVSALQRAFQQTTCLCPPPPSSIAPSPPTPPAAPSLELKHLEPTVVVVSFHSPGLKDQYDENGLAAVLSDTAEREIHTLTVRVTQDATAAKSDAMASAVLLPATVATHQEQPTVRDELPSTSATVHVAGYLCHESTKVAEETRKRLLLLLDSQAEVKTRLAVTAETIPDVYIGARLLANVFCNASSSSGL